MGNKQEKKYEYRTETSSDQIIENKIEYSSKIRDEERKKLKDISHFPCSVNLNGDYCSSCFESINFNKVQIVDMKGNYTFKFVISKDSNINLGTFDFENMVEINIYHNDNKFKKTVENFNQNLRNSYYLIVKKVLYTLNIKQDDLQFTKFYKNIFSRKYKNDNESFSELDRLFQSIGYYAPLQIEIGGFFAFDASEIINNEFSDSQLKSDTDLQLKILNAKNNFSKISKNYLESKFCSSQTKINGGDTNEKVMTKWEKTLTLENAAVIGYKNLVEIISLIPEKYFYNIKGGIDLFKKKYDARNEYVKIYDNIKNIKNGKTFKKDSSQGGHCKTSEVPKIRVEKFDCRLEGKAFSHVRENINKTFDSVIVGWKVIDRWKDGTNGTWEVKNCPLLTYNINITFVSKLFRGQHFTVEVYLMEVPL